MTRRNLSNKGFTLIELLIVIVIIGILAGVVIGVLNPIQQQNRARDATYRSSLNKMALSAKSLFVSSPRTTDRSPTLAEFAGGVGNINDADGDCDTGGGNSRDPSYTGNCLFQVEGLSQDASCGTNGYSGDVSTGGQQCEFVYYRTPTSFRIGVRGVATPVQMFIYEYNESGGTVDEGFYTCDGGDAITATLSGCTELN